MTTARQDAWNQDEDLLLAEVVLRHIRDGGTQLGAFEEVGKKLSRTSAACGFRWNSYVRKQYKSAIEIAKEQRKGKKGKQNVEVDEKNTETNQKKIVSATKTEELKSPLTFQDVITFLEEQQENSSDAEMLLKEQEKFKETISKLKVENDELKKEAEKYKEKCELIEEDYKSLIEIMERARKMVVLNEEDNDQMRFQMDKNGNLQRLKK